MRVQQKQKKNARKRWNVTPYDRGGGSLVVLGPTDLELKVLLMGPTLSTDSTGGWTLALLGCMIGTNEPSIAPTL